MEREANYAAVGAFVLLVALAGALFVYWYSDSREHRSYDRYEIYFAGTVSGLDKGANVRYLGVGVGRVVDLRIDPRDSSRVQVVVDIDSRTPISDHTVAQLQLQGITGLLFIDLAKDKAKVSMTPPVEGLRYPVIRSARSDFDVFLASLPQLVAEANDVVHQAHQVLSDANVAAISSTIGNVAKASDNLPQTLREAHALLADLRAASGEVGAAARSARGLIGGVQPDVLAAAARVRATADHLAQATSELEQVIAENRQDVRAFTRDGLPEIERFVREARAAAEEIGALAASLRENPAQLIYEPPARGVEIPR